MFRLPGNSQVNPAKFDLAEKLTAVTDLVGNTKKVAPEVSKTIIDLIVLVRNTLKSKSFNVTSYEQWSNLLENEITQLRNNGFNNASLQSLTHTLNKIKRETEKIER